MNAAPTLRARAWEAFRVPLAFALAIEVVGAIGYRIISGGAASWLDCFYMTWITVVTVGFGEVIEQAQSPVGRLFTMAIGTAGIANVWYLMSKLTVFIVESRFDEMLRRRRMHERIDKLSGHFILCGIGRVGGNVAHELVVTRRSFVAIDESADILEQQRERNPALIAIHGDASDDDILERAGLARAAGVFAVTGDDGRNLLITLSAKQLNPKARVVARCHEVRNIEKLKRVGADAIVSPDFTGGMRIASSMVRPLVVGFLDEMLRTDEKLRVEEVRVPEGRQACSLGDLVPPSRDYVLLALRGAAGWVFNPPAEHRVEGGNVLIVMAHAEGRSALERRVTGGA